MNKRGEEQATILVFMLVLALIVVLGLWAKVNAQARGELWHQIHYDRDIALALNLYGVGNITISYPMDYDFNVKAEKGTIAVRKETPVIYSYAEGNYDIEIEKVGKELIIKKV